MITTNFNDIKEMWERASLVWTAPEGFKVQCDRYIGRLLDDVLKTNKFIVSDDKYDTGITTIFYKPTTGRYGTYCCLFVRDNKQCWFEELPDDVMYNITKTMEEYVEGRDFSNIDVVCDDEGNKVKDDNGNFIPQRNIEGLIVRPIINDNCVFNKPMDAFYVGMDDFYQATNERLLKMFASDKQRIFALFDHIADMGGNDNVIRRTAYRLLDEGLREVVGDDIDLLPCGNKKYAVLDDISGECESATLVSVCIKRTTFTKDKRHPIVFSFSNGKQETLDTIDLTILRDVLYAFEYTTQYTAEDVKDLAARDIEVKVSDNFINYATHYIYDKVYNILKTSRFAQIWYDQCLPLMDKNHNIIGKIKDIICKGGKVSIEYYQGNDYYDHTRDVKTIDIKEASAITIKHIATLIGNYLKEYEEGTTDYSFIFYVEDKENNIRVPYRVVRGEEVTMEGTYKDEEMKALAKKHSIRKTAINSEFFGNFGEIDAMYDYK